MSDELISNIEEIRKRVALACELAARDRDSVTLVAVSKTHPASLINAAIAAGLTVFGESKVQEADKKIPEIGRRAAEWHLIGHLQSNKTRRAVQLFDVIQTLDSAELAARLDRICKEEGREGLDVLIQVDLAGEATKSGVDKADLSALVETVESYGNLRLRGLMTIPPYFDDPLATRPYFVKLRELRDKYTPGGELSMGMSHDFEVAIEEGATMIRVGTAIFGER